jgi:hypothetical protein
MTNKTDWSREFRSRIQSQIDYFTRNNLYCEYCGDLMDVVHHDTPQFADIVTTFSEKFEFDLNCPIIREGDVYIFAGRVVDLNYICEVFYEYHLLNANLVSLCDLCHRRIHYSM